MPCDPATLRVGEKCYRAQIYPSSDIPSERNGQYHLFASEAVRDGERMAGDDQIFVANEHTKLPSGSLSGAIEFARRGWPHLPIPKTNETESREVASGVA